MRCVIRSGSRKPVRDPALPIEVGPITLEFTVTTRREGEGKAGVKFWVVDAGVSGKLGMRPRRR